MTILRTGDVDSIDFVVFQLDFDDGVSFFSVVPMVVITIDDDDTSPMTLGLEVDASNFLDSICVALCLDLWANSRVEY